MPRRHTSRSSSGRSLRLNRNSQPVDKTSQSLRVWNPPGLSTYLRELQAQYRSSEIPLPRTLAELADEARRDIFNANHVIALLGGLRGPWVVPDLPLWNLPFTLNQFKLLASTVRDREELRPKLGALNRRVQSVMNQVRALPFWSEKDRQKALATLARQKVRLDDYFFRPSQRWGITRHPTKGIAGQGFWTPLVQQLYSYLKRTTREVDKRTYEMIARILHLASEGQYPDDWTRVKRRHYDGLRDEKKWIVGGRVWRTGQLVKTPEGLTVPVIGVSPDKLIRAFVIFLAAVLTREAILIQLATCFLTQATFQIKVALSGPIGHPGSFGLYELDRLQPVEQLSPRLVRDHRG